MASSEAERPIFHLELGEKLKKVRGAKGWSIQRAVIFAKDMHHPALTVNKLRWMEEGKTKFPDAEVLAAIADIYGLNYADLAVAYVSANYGRDLLGQGRKVQRAPHQPGESDVPASEHDRELSKLRGQVAEYRALLGQVENAASTLATVIAAGHQVGEVGASEPKTRRRHRKTG